MAIYDTKQTITCPKCKGMLFHKRPVYRMDRVEKQLEEVYIYTSLICNECGEVVIKNLEER